MNIQDCKLQLPTIPYVSIVVPVLNGEKHVNQCINSLINIDYPKNKFEIIVIDNGSVDTTIKLLKDYPIILLSETKKSSYAARNKGIRHAKGDIIAFTDIDCIVDKNWLFKLVNGFAEDELIGCIGGGIIANKGSTLVEKYSAMVGMLAQEGTLNHEFLPYPQTANAAYKKNVFNKIGYFDDELISGGDADFAWRMQIETNFKLVYIAEAEVRHNHRTTFNGLFKQHFKYAYGSVLLYKKYRKSMRRRKLKSVLRSYIRLVLLLTIFIRRRTIQLLLRRGDNLTSFVPLLSFISSAGFLLGRLYASIKLKVLYL